MGMCIYCRRNAGFFRKVHQRCQMGHALEIVSLRDLGRFKDAVIAAEDAVKLDPALSVVRNQLLSSVYFAAMCNEKDSEAGNAYMEAYFYGAPSGEKKVYNFLMLGCTLEALDCNYAYARELAQRNADAVIRAAKPTSRENHSAREILTILRMMDEMYGVNGDVPNPDFV